MRNTLVALLAIALFGNTESGWAQVRTEIHLDKAHYVAGEPVFVIWKYTNSTSVAVPFERFDPYCPEPGITLRLAVVKREIIGALLYSTIGAPLKGGWKK
jgi:hypothetical protein